MSKVSELIYWHIKRPLGKFPQWVAFRMPRWLVYYCAIRLIANATGGEHQKQVVPDLSAMTALQRWERREA